MKSDSGAWQGVSVDLWQAVAAQRGLDFEWREAALEETLAGLRSGDLDAAVAALSVTSERERSVDFSHPYYVTGLSLAFAFPEGSRLRNEVNLALLDRLSTAEWEATRARYLGK